MISKITFIGFGKLGIALADVLSAKKETCITCGWDVVVTNDPRQVGTLDEATKDASVIFLCVPSEFFSESLKNLKHLSLDVFLISCTKGFDKKTNRLPFEVLRTTFPGNPIGVISGPMLSEELGNGLPTRAILASSNAAVAAEVQKLFFGSNLTLSISEDILGVSLLGILKNVYVLALGLSDGLHLGNNYKSCLALQALQEMQKIIVEKGGKAESIWSEAGVADFLTTGYSTKSRNYTYGFEKARNGHLSDVLSEGIKNISKVRELATPVSHFSLLSIIQKIFIEQADPKSNLLDIWK